MANQQKFIYFPSFSSKYSLLKKDEMKVGNLDTVRFYDDRFPEKYRHKYFLITAGAFFDKKNTNIREQLGLQDSLVFGDSGGFQIAAGTIPWNLDIRDRIFHFLEENGDINMNLDIPPKLKYFGRFEECLRISIDNFKYFQKKQSGKTKFLNVIQGDVDVSSYDRWYAAVKDLEFNGWGIGSTLLQHYNAIYVTALFLKNREFEHKYNHYMHFLGTTSPFNYLIYAVIQNNLNKYYPHCVVTTDSSTPLLQPVYGNWAHTINYKTLNFNYIWVGNKGSVKYIDDAKLPCIFEDCPICSNISYNDIANYKTHTEFAIHVGWHNLFLFTKGVDWLSDLVYGGTDVLKGFFTHDIICMMKSIDEMFEKPEDAMKIFFKYKKLYVKLSNALEKEADKNILADEELFA